MKIEIKRGVCLGGGVDATPGEVHEVADTLARHLIARGSAVPAADSVTTAPAETKTRPRKGITHA